MKRKVFSVFALLSVLAIAFAFPLAALAQTNTPTIPVATNPAVDKIAMFSALIAFGVQAVVVVIKFLALPRIPKVALPILAMALGPAVNYLAMKAGVGGVDSWLLAALAGAGSTGLREIFDQVKKALASTVPEQ